MKKVVLILTVLCVSFTTIAQVNIPKDIKKRKTDYNKPISDTKLKDLKFKPIKGPIIDELIGNIKEGLPYRLKMVSLSTNKVIKENYGSYGSKQIGYYGTSEYERLVNGSTITTSIKERSTGTDRNNNKFNSVDYHISSINGKLVVILKRGSKSGKMLKNATINHKEGFDYMIRGELQEKNITTYYLINASFLINP